MDQSSDNVLINEINITDPYLNVNEDESDKNPTLSTIIPVASQILFCKLIRTYKYTRARVVLITLDSGATVSYIRLSTVTDLGIPIGENGQLAILADQKTRMASLGEIDTELMVDNVIVRLRALVMKELQAEVYRGTTFHTDNSITADINAGEVIIHGKYTVKQFNPMRPVKRFLPSSLSLEDKPGDVRSRNPTLNIAASQGALPSESVPVLSGQEALCGHGLGTLLVK